MNIAVLMSTYNGHSYLNEQLKSLAQQTVAEDVTVYIRDDGSTDDTFEIIEKWKTRMAIVLYKESNAGPAMSFWQLLMKQDIQADYYAFCDQDDVWDPNKLEVAIKQLNSNTHFCACNCRIIDENGIIIDEKRCKKVPDISMEKLFVSGVTQGCSMVFDDALRRFIIEKKLQCIPMHDVVLMLYAMSFGIIYWDQEPHFSYRVHSNNVVAKSNKSITQKIKTTWWNWKNSSNHSMATVACEMLNNIKNMSDEEKSFLERVSKYRHSIRCKMAIICNESINDIPKQLLRSYRLRVLLNLY